jgi:Tfp pilus assembly protein PilO
MNSPENVERRGRGLHERLLDKLHEPLPLKICVMAAVLSAGYFAVYKPMRDKIDLSAKILDRDRKLIEQATKHEALKKEFQLYEKRIPPQTDTKEWMQYVLDGIRRFPLKMGKFDCRDVKQADPFKIVSFQIELEGSFFDLRKFLQWIEENQRLLRVDEMAIAPARDPQMLNMRITLLGLSG